MHWLPLHLALLHRLLLLLLRLISCDLLFVLRRFVAFVLAASVFSCISCCCCYCIASVDRLLSHPPLLLLLRLIQLNLLLYSRRLLHLFGCIGFCCCVQAAAYCV
jgi:hypothetical protein